MTLQGGADLIIDVNELGFPLNIGYFSGDYGTVIAGDGSSIQVDDNIYIGYEGEGTLTFTGDASFTSTGSSQVYLGRKDSGKGVWTGAHGSVGGAFYIGHEGQGEVYMSSGDELTTGASLYVARNTGAYGYLELESGAKLSTTSLFVADFEDADVLATDSEIITSGAVAVGDAGYTGNTGTLTVSGGSLQIGIYLEAADSASGAVYFKDGAQISIGTDLRVADSLNPNDSETGLLSVTSATATERTLLDITGNASIESNGTWTTDNISNVRIGDGDLSSVSTNGYVFISDTTGAGGTLTFDEGGFSGPLVATFGGELLMGWNAGESGTVNLFDSESVLTTEGAVRLGENGTATVNMDGGAIWYANDSTFDMADQTGNATITLENSSQLIVTDTTIEVGDGSGTAAINILSGSTVEATHLSLGDDASTGTLTVDAANLNVERNLYVGDGSTTQNGIGTASFTNGSVLAINRFIYTGFHGTGTVTIDNSTWETTTSE